MHREAKNADTISTPTLTVTRFRVQHKKAILMAYINGRYNIMAMDYGLWAIWHSKTAVKRKYFA